MSVIRTGAGLSVTYRPRALLVGGACLVLALVAAVFAIGSGEYPMAPADVVRTLVGQGDPADAFIVQELRLPRTVTALLVGTALGLCGAVFQAVVRNPLGSPDILGFTNGAATGALVVIVVAGGGSAFLAGGAVLGAVVVSGLIYALAWKRGMHGYRLVLVGVGATAILTGVNSYLITRAQITEASRAVLWMTGSLDGRGWSNALPLLAGMAVLVPLVLFGCARALRMMEMGDDAAYALGVRVERTRLALLGAGVLLVALSAAAAGPVSFVALTAPQLARRLTKAPGPNLVPAMCMGAVLLVTADLVAQRAFGDHQLPVGVITGVLGGGYLVWLLATERRAGRI
ncbi:FecCD family ABC transporter permease [Streptomyces iconiensis]|uniref:Iron chelate uptake ABC transporter family permease subunit n=1 Tax=Streptomyces iconiensis TaxID=1384038 RepID=A0ABT7A5W5_9ACTN|nr:iron chelate uptake ABC transporter family permease subunit [Streptomyces iconiensis]MDJ1136727.1 iron chelate uptake ABC transporter family permease subunit [Streptomyces iconiensis]